MLAYIIKNKDESNVPEEQVDGFIKNFWPEYTKNQFNLYWGVPNNAHVLKNSGEPVCRIDSHYSDEATRLVISGFKEDVEGKVSKALENKFKAIKL